MWTISGWPVGRPLTAKIRRDGARRRRRRRRGRTRSRSGSRPARRRAARVDGAASTSRRDEPVSAGTASRNSSAASMKPNDSGVAKWSMLRSTTSAGVGQRRDERVGRAGEVAVADDDQHRARRRPSSSLGRERRRRRAGCITAASAARSLPGCVGVLAEQAADVVVGVAACPRRRRGSARARSSSRSNTLRPMPASTSRRNRSGRRIASRSSVIAPSEKPTASTGSVGQRVDDPRRQVGVRRRVVRLRAPAVAEQVDADHRRGRRRRAAR